ncbi:MAG: glycerophosphodiester phosphodiesterase family protein, partial [Lewinella sp.]|uniref:glycerophosphodiester phosphodiesterase family protein n=1 Tax=Lewinella sp. TaxID=2004506 RepID=UPI003D6A1CE5
MHRILILLIITATSCSKATRILNESQYMITTSFDWQGHRGARGLLPENTLPAFAHALTYPDVKTLELDIAVTKDQQLVISHEPWMAALICTHPDGNSVTEEEEKSLIIHQMTLPEVQAFDCGSRGNANFPEQQARIVRKPTLAAMVEMAEQIAHDLKRPLPYYNIEIKSLPEWDETFTPLPDEFARLLLKELTRLGIAERTTIQSFDVRSLQAVRQQAPTQSLAYLVANKNTLERNLDTLGFLPEIYSPYYLLCTPELTQSLHQQNIQLIPWTVNDPKEMQRLIDMGVDGIITDYPNRIRKLYTSASLD